jgi:hypothetical protein
MVLPIRFVAFRGDDGASDGDRGDLAGEVKVVFAECQDFAHAGGGAEHDLDNS